MRKSRNLQANGFLTVYMKLPKSNQEETVRPTEHYRVLKLSLTNLMFNQEECKVATFRDVTDKSKLAKIEADNKLLHMLTSSVTHEMVTPLKCMVSFSEIVVKALANSPKKYEAELIMTTSKLLLS